MTIEVIPPDVRKNKPAVALYAITKDEFRTPITTPVAENAALERVNRGNFVAVMIHTFAIAQGQPSAQALSWEWLRVNLGFDYRKTVTNYQEAEGHKSLSDREKNMVWDAFRSIKAHMTAFQQFGAEISRSNILREFDTVLDMISAMGERERLMPTVPLAGVSQEAALVLIRYRAHEARTERGRTK